jgi:acetaldehyde dehydrogenase
MCIVDNCDQETVSRAVEQMVDQVRAYVPGYRLMQDVHFRRFGPEDFETDLVPGLPPADRWVVSVLLQVEGAAHYLPPYAGNLDIMTSAAMQTAERMLEKVSV